MNGIIFSGAAGEVFGLIHRLGTSCKKVSGTKNPKLSEMITCIEAMQATQYIQLTIDDINDRLDVMELEKMD